MIYLLALGIQLAPDFTKNFAQLTESGIRVRVLDFLTFGGTEANITGRSSLHFWLAVIGSLWLPY